MTVAPITVRAVLELLLAADSYPHVGNHDSIKAAYLEVNALSLAKTPVESSDDPPDFKQWLTALLTPNLPASQHDEVYWSMHDFFDPDERR